MTRRPQRSLQDQHQAGHKEKRRPIHVRRSEATRLTRPPRPPAAGARSTNHEHQVARLIADASLISATGDKASAHFRTPVRRRITPRASPARSVHPPKLHEFLRRGAARAPRLPGYRRAIPLRSKTRAPPCESRRRSPPLDRFSCHAFDRSMSSVDMF